MASPSLLATYNTERQPAAEKTMQQVYSRLVNHVLADKSVPHDEEVPDDVCELGYCYPAGAFVYDQVEHEPRTWDNPASPSVKAGSRIPHVPIVGQTASGSVSSTLDLVRTSFILLTAEPDSHWLSAAARQAVPIDAYAIFEDSNPISDPSGQLRKLYKL
ncbi:hypothetical protein BDV12DRAFT_203886 [Aspergillus spectabilis]